MARKGREDAARVTRTCRNSTRSCRRNVIARLASGPPPAHRRVGALHAVEVRGPVPLDSRLDDARNAESDEPSFARQSRGNGHRVSEGTLVLDQVVGGEHEHDGVSSVARLYEHRRKGDRRRCVAAERFEEINRVARFVGAESRVDVLGAEVVVAVGDGHESGHAGQRRRPMRRFGEQRSAVGQQHERLRRGFARQRPQAGAGSAGKDYGNDGSCAFGIHAHAWNAIGSGSLPYCQRPPLRRRCGRMRPLKYPAQSPFLG
jgi:hypothetical protein